MAGELPSGAQNEDTIRLEHLINRHSGRRSEAYEDYEVSYSQGMAELARTKASIHEHPYYLPLHIHLAQIYLALYYPDLAAGAAYKALLLSDAVQDEGDEYHVQAVDAIESVVSQLSAESSTEPHLSNDQNGHTKDSDENVEFPAQICVTSYYLPLIYRVLAQSLLMCECYQTAFNYSSQALRMYPEELELQEIRNEVRGAVARHFNISLDELGSGDYKNGSNWPDHGFVRRELYPWNDLEPDRLQSLSELNALMAEVAPKLEVSAIELLNLNSDSGEHKHIKQLGVFAKEDIESGEIILNERSMLTANNKLQDALCDACSIELPELDSPESKRTRSCPECQVVFCSERCYEEAVERYHPALCCMDVEGIAKDVTPTKSADALYSLLLLRTLAMAQTRQCHPLELKEVKFIWGDFNTSQKEDCLDDHNPKASNFPRTLPFSFEENIRLPFHMLEKMDIDIFANPQYDVWVFNTLYAKYRGTASARLSGLGGRAARGPEVSAVHPMWCLANHSCDPNVSWEWGGSIKFWTRRARVTWERDGEKADSTSRAGIKQGEEVLNHYCDVELPVKERREWARGALGGDCRCARCVWEAKEDGRLWSGWPSKDLSHPVLLHFC